MSTFKLLKSKVSAMLFMITFMVTSTVAMGAETSVKSTSENAATSQNEKAHAEQLISRIHEIASLNKKELNREERSQLKKEVTGIKKELKELGGGVYISATLLVVILILIILL